MCSDSFTAGTKLWNKKPIIILHVDKIERMTLKFQCHTFIKVEKPKTQKLGLIYYNLGICSSSQPSADFFTATGETFHRYIWSWYIYIWSCPMPCGRPLILGMPQLWDCAWQFDHPFFQWIPAFWVHWISQMGEFIELHLKVLTHAINIFTFSWNCYMYIERTYDSSSLGCLPSLLLANQVGEDVDKCFLVHV